MTDAAPGLVHVLGPQGGRRRQPARETHRDTCRPLRSVPGRAEGLLGAAPASGARHPVFKKRSSPQSQTPLPRRASASKQTRGESVSLLMLSVGPRGADTEDTGHAPSC